MRLNRKWLRWIAVPAVTFAVACGSDDVAGNDGQDNDGQDGDAIIEVADDSLSWNLEVGQSETSRFEIGNIGDAALDFEIDHDADWLDVDPVGGSVDADEQLGIDVTASCGEQVGSFDTTLAIDSNDADDTVVEIEAVLNCEPMAPGSLEIIVAGLPDGQDADIEIEGPDGFAEQIMATQAFEEVAVGTYTITASTVGDDAMYSPEPEQTTIDVERQSAADVTIEYQAVPGDLQVEVTGLPDGVDHEINVVGQSDAWPVPQDGLVEGLDPVSYTVVPENVVDGATLYEASSVALTIISETVVDVTINYIIDPGYLEVDVDGLPAGVDHDIDLVDQDGNITALPPTGELTLEPGTYAIEAHDVTDGLATFEASGNETVDIESGITADISVTYEVIDGEITIEIDGLPAGVTADVTLSGGGQTLSVTDTTTFDDLYPDTYDITVDDVTDGPATYEGVSTTVDVESGTNPTVTIDYELIEAELSVSIAGDLGGNAADVDISGPNGFSQNLGSAQTFDDLVPGDYTVTVNDVIDGPATYEGTGSQTLTLNSGDAESVTANYQVITAALAITISGDLDGNDPDVTVTGPDGFSETVTADVNYTSLFPGDYTVTVNDVVDGPATFEGTGTDTLTLASGDSEVRTANYELILGSLTISATGLPAGVAPSIEVDGQGFNATYDADTTIDDLEPGDYTVTYHDVSDGGATYEVDDSSATLTVESGQTADVERQYEAVPGDIVVAVETFGSPTFEVSITGPNGFSETIDADASFSDVHPGDYTLSVDTVDTDALGNEGYVVVEPDSFTLDSQALQNVDIEAAVPALVTTEADVGPGSLREVLDGIVDGTTVEFDDSVENVVVSGDQIIIDSTVDLAGRDDMSVTIDGDGSRIFLVASGQFLGLHELTLSGGIGEDGGAVYVDSDASAYTWKTVFEDNEAVVNEDSFRGHGGAIFVDANGEIDVRESIFRNNIAAGHGGALSTTTSSATDTVADIRQSFFENNESGSRGGALQLVGDNSRVEDSTFVDNTAGSNGGAINAWYDEITIIGVTVVGNHAQSNSGGIHQYGNGQVDLFLGRSIIANNTADGSYPDIGRTSDGTSADVISLGFNFIGIDDGASGLVDGENGDQVGDLADPIDPDLLVLADNGGFSMTFEPAVGSPVRSNIPADECDDTGEVDELHDQRGQHRPAGAFCSVGAYEVDSLLETFDNADMSATSYQTGSFVGDNGITWNYEETRRSISTYTIDGESLMFDGDPSSRVYSETLSGGISSLSMQIAQGFTSDNDRQVEVLVNGNSVGTSQIINEAGSAPYPVHRFAVEDINITGDFDIEIRSIGDAQIVIDNVSWK